MYVLDVSDLIVTPTPGANETLPAAFLTTTICVPTGKFTVPLGGTVIAASDELVISMTLPWSVRTNVYAVVCWVIDAGPRIVVPVTVNALFTVVVPVAAPMLIVVAAFAKFTVVAVVFTRSNDDDPVVRLVVTLGDVIVGLELNTTTPPVPVYDEKSVSPLSQSAAVVNDVPMHVTIAVVPVGTEMTRLPPEEFTVNVPVLLLTIWNVQPVCSVLVTGRTIVWLDEPVNCW